MIPAFLVEKFGPTLAKIIFWGAVAVLVLVLLSIGKCSYDQRAKTELKLKTNQVDAARQSGTDAVQTFGNTQANETATDQVGRENSDAIDKTSGAHNAVADDTRIAGLQSLCRRSSYRASHAECVQHPAPH